ncbi:hypothetical protein [Metabacillus sp. Hm71]|uniref:hypothetical protein n=1 Tax=Metabacillus sp. Hm71 TaxID=3450743 RepID=UPI003F424D9A
MKITCDCGNETKFIPAKYEPCFEGDEPMVDNSYQYTKYDEDKFGIWSRHGDEQGITCKQCGKKIWFY